MTIPAQLAKARKRLKLAQIATSRFIAKHKGTPVSPVDAGKYILLLNAEMKALIHLSNVQIGPTQKGSHKRKT